MLKDKITEIAEVLKKKDIVNPVIPAALGITFLMILGDAYGITAPDSKALAYDLYDVGVNKLLKGPVGFIGGMLGIVIAASQLSKNWIPASLGILGSTALLKADSITTSLGVLF